MTTIADLLIGKRVRAIKDIGSINKGDIVTIAEGAWICVDNNYELLDEVHFVPEEHKHRYTCVTCNKEDTVSEPEKKQKPSQIILEMVGKRSLEDMSRKTYTAYPILVTDAILEYLDKQAETK